MRLIFDANSRVGRRLIDPAGTALQIQDEYGFKRPGDKPIPVDALQEIGRLIVAVDFPFNLGGQLPVVSGLFGDNAIRIVVRQ